MPVIETDYAARSPREQELLRELVEELRNPRPHGQPLIEIKQMSRGGVRHVHVIWDRWDGCPPETRAAVIRDAFTEVKGPEYERAIAITIAATIPEAGEAGLLPFEVKPYGWYQLDRPAMDEVRDVLLKEGGSPLGKSWLPALRFATMEQAEAAVKRLREHSPKYEWGVVTTHFMSG